MRRTLLTLALLVGTTTAAASAASFGPPWISIEYPGNPFDGANAGAYLYVHTFHHNDAINASPRGTAEGIVGGQRRTVALSFQGTSRPGTFALRQQWPREGTWMLVISTGAPPGNATALVDIGASGDVAAVRVPSRLQEGRPIPTPVTAADVDAALRARTSQVAAVPRR